MTGASRPRHLVVYLDESIVSRVLADRLKSLGVDVRIPGGAIPYGAPDEQWLAICGERDWTVLMRDQRIRYRAIERAALIDARVGAFVLTAGQATATETADVLERLLPRLRRLAAYEPRPFLFTFGLRSQPTRVPLAHR